MNNKLGQVTREADGFKVRFERTFNHSVDTVWEAITDPAKLKYWFTDIELNLKPGAKITFYFRDKAKTASYGKVVAIEKGKKFIWTWENEQAEWELFNDGPNKCKVVLTYSKLEPFFAEKAPAGFHLLLDRLSQALDGKKELYPFGTEGTDPEFEPIRAKYEDAVFREFPDLLRQRPIVVEKTIKAKADRVWKALTDKEQMTQWYFDVSAFKAEVGFEFSFAGKGAKGETYQHLCKIIEVVPMQKLSYSWRYDGYPGDSVVTFELIPNGEETTVKLTHAGVGSFATDNPDFGRNSFEAGWNYLIGKSLPAFVEEK